VANFYIIAQKRRVDHSSFYGGGVISLSIGVVNGSTGDQYHVDGFSKRMDKIEHHLKMCLSLASGHAHCIFFKLLT
jgi:hypothetical protein